MKRPLAILVLLLICGIAAGAGAYFASKQVCVRRMAGPDELAWLRREFKLGDQEMARVRELHSGYLPQCREMCARIATAREELEATLASDQVDQVEAKLVELGTLRAKCQAQMLRHFHEVSRAMPPEQGRRYLAEMQRLTLGFHEQVESSMSEGSHTGHGPH